MQPMFLRSRVTLFSAALSLALAAGTSQTLAAPLSIALGGSVTSIDPHFYNATPNYSATRHIFDTLTQTNAAIQLEPALATSWKSISDTVWEFKLREGVTWHDGKPFTADDVAFTVERAPTVPNSPGGFGPFVRAIQKVEVVDPLTVRFHTAGPTPNLARDLASVAIISRHAGTGATTEDYNSGKAAIGTGPYKFASYTPGDRIEFTRNDNWWGPKQEWDKVTLRIITNPGARVAALLSGGVDVIDTPPATDLPRLQKDDRVQVFDTEGVRLIFLAPDYSHKGAVPGVTDHAGKPLDKNPFLDQRVRQALSIAINRQALTDRVMQGTAAPAGQWLPKGAYSYAPSVQPPAFDPEGAKKLLAEAGYPDGFQLVLFTPNDRYPNDAATAQTVAALWSRVGVKTAVEALPWAAYTSRRAKQEFGFALGGWGSQTGESGYALTNVVGTYDTAKKTGATNNARYSNPTVDALRDKALSTLDDAEREKLLIQAVETAAQDVAIIPLHLLSNFWGVRKGLAIDPRKDERTLATGIRSTP